MTALGEEEIVRYSRQILLREVGGVGQEKLLSTRVRLLGTGPALSTAAMLLAASGIQVEARSAVQGERSEDVIWVGEMPARFPGGQRTVALGESEGQPVVLLRAPPGCADCFAAALGGGGPAPEDARSVRLAGLAALSVQRLVLGLGEPLLRVALEPSGWTVSIPRICPRCR